MTIDPVKIPQNVYIEDRIIGPITLKQIMAVMFSAGVSYAVWASMKASGPVSAAGTTMATIPTLIGIAFAFIKINGISLFRIVLLALERFDKPATRVFAPRQGIYVNIVTKVKKGKPTNTNPASVEKKQTHIEELSRVLDLGPKDIEDALTETNESSLENVAEQKKPVQRERIVADKRLTPVDDIAPAEKEAPFHTFGPNLLRDISPPPSHV